MSRGKEGSRQMGEEQGEDWGGGGGRPGLWTERLVAVGVSRAVSGDGATRLEGDEKCGKREG